MYMLPVTPAVFCKKIHIILDTRSRDNVSNSVTSNNVFKSFESKGKKTEKQPKYFTFVYKKVNIWERCIYCLKLTKDSFMFLVGD